MPDGSGLNGFQFESVVSMALIKCPTLSGTLATSGEMACAESASSSTPGPVADEPSEASATETYRLERGPGSVMPDGGATAMPSPPCSRNPATLGCASTWPVAEA